MAGDDPVLREYRSLAAGYDRRWAGYVARTAALALAHAAARVPRGGRICDVGCGTGVLPAGLAELRPYQLVGYRWLAQLADWGAGACLADDMGLGKTVQTLALLLHRAAGGPALVVAPTSVCATWQREAARFAPELTIHHVADLARDARGEHVAALGPGDVLVAGYALLQRSREALTAVDWHTAVLDEAHAIKNAAAGRAQAARALRATARVALTGTPVENRLADLHSLFAFLQPGLLGSAEHFARHFAIPIERDGDEAARTRLRRLLRPFLLRRDKTAVCAELPPRSELRIDVEPDAEERACYEALRREAEQRVAEAGGEQADRMTILAQLTRLRRACCHPRLVLPEADDAPAAKQRAFLELFDELRAGGHRCLVFSQFVDHLQLVRALLDERGVAYQYLDGATPERQRRARVAAFQAGEGAAFLISLKAGGTGLTLTGADYVIHLDPWWNPAVEDQASDRAHRIGQDKPVTIYRLVVPDSIEDGILALHERKRGLAADLLDGTGTALAGDELLALLRGAAGAVGTGAG